MAQVEARQRRGGLERRQQVGGRSERDGSTATLERVVPFGAATRAVVSIDGGRVLIDTPPTGLRPGSLVDVRIDEAAARPIG